MGDADRRFRVHPLWRQQWERDEDSPYQRLSEPDIAWRFAREIYRKDPAAAVDDDALDIGFGDGASRLVEKVGNTVGRVDEPGGRLTAQDRERGSVWDRASISRESMREPGLIPAAPRALRPAEVRPADLSIRERIGNAAMDIGARLGADRSTQHDLNRQATELADFVPGLSLAVGLNDASRQIKAGNLTGGAAELGLAAAGILPGVGGMVKNAGGKTVRDAVVHHSRDSSYNAFLSKAKELGYRTDIPGYHGTADDISAFDPLRARSNTNRRVAQQGVSVALNPETAGAFARMAGSASGSGENILPLLYRSRKPAEMRLAGDEKDHEIAASLSLAWEKGYDTVTIRNYTMPGGRKEDFVVVKDPSLLRVPWAKFDPAKVGSDDLLAGVIPLGPLGFGIPLGRGQEDESSGHENQE